MKLSTLLICLLALTSCERSPFQSRQKIAKYHGSLDKIEGPDEEKELIHNFPKALYKKVNVPGSGNFYIDSRVDIIKNRLRRGLPWEPEISAIMQQVVKPGTTAIDVGSHIGTHTVTLSNLVGDRGRVIAFEPQMKLYSELVMNLELNKKKNVTAYRAAVGNVYQNIEMNMPVPDNEGGTAIGSGGDSAIMITLDSLGLDNVSFMKIDAVNLEEQVLLGAKETIRKNKPVIILEIMGNIYQHDPERGEKIERTIKLLESMGYKVEYIENSWSDFLAVPV